MKQAATLLSAGAADIVEHAEKDWLVDESNRTPNLLDYACWML